MDEKTRPSVTGAIVSMAVIVLAIVGSIKLGFGTAMAVFSGALVSIAIAFVFKAKWVEIEQETTKSIGDCTMALLILVLVGLMVGVWMIGGSIATLIYYGLELITPAAVVPLAFVLCSLTSVFTGSSYGSIATMGLATFGVGINLGIPAALMAGSVVSGAYFGDKMSPMSSTTNTAPAVSGTDLYSHIYSMLYSTVPAYVVCLVLYIILGIKYAGSAIDGSQIQLLLDTFAANFNITWVTMIPMLMVLVFSVCKVPAILSMSIATVISVVIALVTQNCSVSNVMSVAINGFVSNTGVEMVDNILTRGGLRSMIDTIAIIFFSGIMAGALRASGVQDTMERVIARAVKSTVSLIGTTLLFCYGMVAMTGNQMMGIIVPGQTMAPVFKKQNVHPKVLSRCLEDAGTLGSSIIPWSAACAYVKGVLGVGPEYIPFVFLAWIVPVFSMILAVTKFGVWDGDNQPMWKKKKSANEA